MNILNDFNFSLLENFSSSAEGEYSKYVKDHIKNVQKAYEYIKENIPELLEDLEISVEEMDEQIKEHDRSKFGPDEFSQYAEHWYGKIENGKRCEKDDESKEYLDAWKHHYKNNPHHEEFWGKKKDVPYSCLLEMLCDWWAFSFKKGDLYEITEFWREKKGEKSKHLSENSIKRIDEMIEKLALNLQKYSNADLNSLSEALNTLTESSLFNIKSIINTNQFDAVEKLIKGSQKILIVRHISPDADAIGAAKSMKDAIESKYPKKTVILGSETTREDLTKDDLLIILDLGVKERIAAEYLGDPKTVRIDHHKTGMPADVAIELPDSGSTCELITLFLKDQKYQIPKKMAEDLFKGIITDTGRMQYSLSDTTLAAMSILRDLGIDYKKIYNKMYVKDDISIKSKAYILSNYKKTPNGVAYLFLDHERTSKAGIDMHKTAQQVYEMGEIKGCPIWVIISEKNKNNLTMRVRSRVIPINKIAAEFGGGGHDNAAGIKVKNRDEVKEVLKRLDRALVEFNSKNNYILETIDVKKEYDGRTLEIELDADADLGDQESHKIKSKNAVLKLKRKGNLLDIEVDIDTDIREKNDENIKKYNEKLKHDIEHAKKMGVPKNIPEVLFDALSELSEKQIGAFLIFEKDQSLDKYCKNGTKMNCPISEDIFMSIFYPGTEVHDGATIIKDGIIKYSSVFLQNIASDSFDEHYGARHRAAMGLSKQTDAFCIVVSEETGNISFAIDGKLTIVNDSKEKFIKLFNKESN